MANGEKVTVIRGKNQVAIVISNDVAITLMSLSGSILGESETTYRGHCDAVYRALHNTLGRNDRRFDLKGIMANNKE